MEKWNIKRIEFAPGVKEKIDFFVDEQHPELKKMVEDRIKDLLNYPDLLWQIVEMEDRVNGRFITKNQQIELAGKVSRKKSLAVITHFGFHR